ncbi:MAG TPA: hypothetical protein VJ911_05765 [Cryomorphaceae bacterium]|nr:hypothetical protein [Cryomorphaceae bacterium]
MKILYAIAFVFLFAGCDIFDKDEEIPSFLYIEKADVTTNSATQGANTHEIVDATVFANSIFVGTFELPATVPILESGDTRISIGAGIKNNGISTNRVIYPFYEINRRNLTLVPDAVTPISADSTVTFTYFDTGINYFIEGFEDLGNTLEAFPENNVSFNVIDSPPEDVSRGQSLKIDLTSENNVFYAATTWSLTNLPTGINMYMEIDYKGNHPVDIGIITRDSPNNKIFAGGINPTDEWTKVYLELTDEISEQITNNVYDIFLESRIEPGQQNRTIYIDNIKFLHP